MSTVKIKPQLKDVVESDAFNAVDFVNKLFPTEASLSQLDEVVLSVRKQVQQIDNDVFDRIRAQSVSNSKAWQDLSMTKVQMAELFHKMGEIQKKATRTEKRVQEICRDIKKLDYAKQHITFAITQLRKLAMLSMAVKQLETKMTDRNEYRECANLLGAVFQLASHFTYFKHLAKVAELKAKLSIIHQVLKDQVSEDFKQNIKDHDPTPENGGADDQSQVLQDYRKVWNFLGNACLVVDVLGPKVRNELAVTLCNREIEIYKSTIPFENKQFRTLDSMDKRYNWLLNRLRNPFLQEQRKLFPPRWQLTEFTCMTFCKICAMQLAEILDNLRDELVQNTNSQQQQQSQQNVGQLLKSVKSTKDFERTLKNLFALGTDGYSGGQNQLMDDSQDVQSPQAAKARLQIKLVQQKIKDNNNSNKEPQSPTSPMSPTTLLAQQSLEIDQGISLIPPNFSFEGILSDIFEPHLGIYVNQQEQECRELMRKYIQSEKERGWVSMSGEMQVLQSANDLLLQIKKFADRCYDWVSDGEVLLNVAAGLQKVLSEYASELIKRLPKSQSGHLILTLPLIGPDWILKASNEELQIVCRILRTAEFCIERAQQMQSYLVKKLKPPFGQHVSFAEAEESFGQVQSSCLVVLVLAVNSRLEVALQDMARTSWSTMEQVGDLSQYVYTVQSVFSEFSTILRENISIMDFEYFCDKMARGFIPRHYETIFKCKRQTQAGNHQLLLNTQDIKKTMRDFPKNFQPFEKEVADQDGLSVAIQRYTSYVNSEMQKAETLLKVASSSPEALIETFIALTPENQKNVAEFQKVAELKNIKKQDMQNLIIQFQRQLGVQQVAQNGIPAHNGMDIDQQMANQNLDLSLQAQLQQAQLDPNMAHKMQFIANQAQQGINLQQIGQSGTKMFQDTARKLQERGVAFSSFFNRKQ